MAPRRGPQIDGSSFSKIRLFSAGNTSAALTSVQHRPNARPDWQFPGYASGQRLHGGEQVERVGPLHRVFEMELPRTPLANEKRPPATCSRVHASRLSYSALPSPSSPFQILGYVPRTIPIPRLLFQPRFFDRASYTPTIHRLIHLISWVSPLPLIACLPSAPQLHQRAFRAFPTLVYIYRASHIEYIRRNRTLCATWSPAPFATIAKYRPRTY